MSFSSTTGNIPVPPSVDEDIEANKKRILGLQATLDRLKHEQKRGLLSARSANDERGDSPNDATAYFKFSYSTQVPVASSNENKPSSAYIFEVKNLTTGTDRLVLKSHKEFHIFHRKISRELKNVKLPQLPSRKGVTGDQLQRYLTELSMSSAAISRSKRFLKFVGEIEEEIAGRVSSSRDSSRDNTPRDSASSDVHLSSSGHSTPLASPSSRRRIKRKDSGLDVNATSPGSRRRGGMPRASSAKSPARLSHDTSPRGVDLKRQMSQREMVSERLAVSQSVKRDSMSAFGLNEMPLAIDVILPGRSGRRTLNLSAGVTFGEAKKSVLRLMKINSKKHGDRFSLGLPNSTTIYNESERIVSLIEVQKAIASGEDVVFQLYETKSSDSKSDSKSESGLARAKTAPAAKHRITPLTELRRVAETLPPPPLPPSPRSRNKQLPLYDDYRNSPLRKARSDLPRKGAGLSPRGQAAVSPRLLQTTLPPVRKSHVNERDSIMIVDGKLPLDGNLLSSVSLQRSTSRSDRGAASLVSTEHSDASRVEEASSSTTEPEIALCDDSPRALSSSSSEVRPAFKAPAPPPLDLAAAAIASAQANRSSPHSYHSPTKSSPLSPRHVARAARSFVARLSPRGSPRQTSPLQSPQRTPSARLTTAHLSPSELGSPADQSDTTPIPLPASSGAALTLYVAMSDPNTGVPRKQSLLHRSTDLFTGADACTWLVQTKRASNRADAVQVGDILEQYGLLAHDSFAHAFDDNSLAYRLAPRAANGTVQRFIEQDDISRLEVLLSGLSGVLLMLTNERRGIPLTQRAGHAAAFAGRDAVNWMIERGLVTTRRAAIVLGRAMTRNGSIRSVDGAVRDFDDKNVFYQFTSAATTSVDESLRRHRSNAAEVGTSLDTSRSGLGSASSSSFKKNQRPTLAKSSSLRSVGAEPSEEASVVPVNYDDDDTVTEKPSDAPASPTSASSLLTSDNSNNNNIDNNGVSSIKLWGSSEAPRSPTHESDKQQEAALRHLDRLNTSAHHAIAGGVSPRNIRRRRTGSSPAPLDKPPLPMTASPRRSPLTTSKRHSRNASPNGSPRRSPRPLTFAAKKLSESTRERAGSVAEPGPFGGVVQPPLPDSERLETIIDKLKPERPLSTPPKEAASLRWPKVNPLINETVLADANFICDLGKHVPVDVTESETPSVSRSVSAKKLSPRQQIELNSSMKPNTSAPEPNVNRTMQKSTSASSPRSHTAGDEDESVSMGERRLRDSPQSLRASPRYVRPLDVSSSRPLRRGAQTLRRLSTEGNVADFAERRDRRRGSLGGDAGDELDANTAVMRVRRRVSRRTWSAEANATVPRRNSLDMTSSSLSESRRMQLGDPSSNSSPRADTSTPSSQRRRRRNSFVELSAQRTPENSPLTSKRGRIGDADGFNDVPTPQQPVKVRSRRRSRSGERSALTRTSSAGAAAERDDSDNDATRQEFENVFSAESDGDKSTTATTSARTKLTFLDELEQNVEKTEPSNNSTTTDTDEPASLNTSLRSVDPDTNSQLSFLEELDSLPPSMNSSRRTPLSRSPSRDDVLDASPKRSRKSVLKAVVRSLRGSPSREPSDENLLRRTSTASGDDEGVPQLDRRRSLLSLVADATSDEDESSSGDEFETDSESEFSSEYETDSDASSTIDSADLAHEFTSVRSIKAQRAPSGSKLEFVSLRSDVDDDSTDSLGEIFATTASRRGSAPVPQQPFDAKSPLRKATTNTTNKKTSPKTNVIQQEANVLSVNAPPSPLLSRFRRNRRLAASNEVAIALTGDDKKNPIKTFSAEPVKSPPKNIPNLSSRASSTGVGHQVDSVSSSPAAGSASPGIPRRMTAFLTRGRRSSTGGSSQLTPVASPVDTKPKKIKSKRRKKKKRRDLTNLKLIDSENDVDFYSAHFLDREHTNLYTRKYEVISLGSVIDGQYHVKVWSKEGFTHLALPYDLVKTKRFGFKPTTKAKLQPVKHILPKLEINDVKPLKPSATVELAVLELSQMVKHYKFGVLCVSPGHKTEEDIYSNNEASPAYTEFLDVLGEQVRLKDFDKYRAGLDVKTDSTGEYSVYTQYRDFEVMFHVCHMLPFSEANPQQLHRKRHIGNDIVVVVFVDGDCTFDPRVITSNFNHVFVVVQADRTCSPTRYKVATVAKAPMMKFGPQLPERGVFVQAPLFRQWLLTKCINAERAAYHAPAFRSKIASTRTSLLKDVIDKHK